MSPHFPQFDVNLVLGPLFIGNCVSIFLAGVSTVQAYIYYTRYTEDKRILKYFVGAVWVLDMAHTGVTAAGVYQACVSYFGHPERFVVAPKTLCATLLVSGIIYPLVQGFFAHRIWVLTESRILAGICCALIVARSATTITMGGTALAMSSLMTYLVQYSWLGSFAIAVSTVGDLVVAISLSIVLLRRKSHLVSKTTKIVDKLILWTLETGVLTSVTTTTLLVCFLAMPHNCASHPRSYTRAQLLAGIWVSIIILVPRLYTNSLYASLNARASLNNMSNVMPTIPTSLLFAHPSARPEPISVGLTTSRLSNPASDREPNRVKSTEQVC